MLLHQIDFSLFWHFVFFWLPSLFMGSLRVVREPRKSRFLIIQILLIKRFEKLVRLVACRMIRKFQVPRTRERTWKGPQKEPEAVWQKLRLMRMPCILHSGHMQPAIRLISMCVQWTLFMFRPFVGHRITAGTRTKEPEFGFSFVCFERLPESPHRTRRNPPPISGASYRCVRPAIGCSSDSFWCVHRTHCSSLLPLSL